MVLDELRRVVRDQLGLDEADLPNTSVDFFLRAGYDMTFAAERNWPFFETQWTPATVSGDRAVVAPTDYAGHSLVVHSEVGPLMQLDHEFAMTQFHDITDQGAPDFFSVRGGTFYLWPHLEDAAYTLTIVGYRKPATFPVGGGDELDGDDRLHVAVAWYACSLAKSQEEDYEGAAKYMADWDATLQMVRKDLMRADNLRVRRLNSGADRLGIWH